MTEQTRIPIDEADLPTLKNFAMILGIEVKDGTNAKQVRGMIDRAAPGTKDVPALPPQPSVASMPGAPAHESVPMMARQPSDPEPSAPYRETGLPVEPRVELLVHKTDDKRRPADVTLNVNGSVTRFKRGVKVSVPYSVYRALENAVENAAVETDEVNPVTGLPIMAWEEVKSYPYQIYTMPDDAQVAAWMQATKDVQHAVGGR